MYIENKGRGLLGPAVIGRVTFSKTGRTLYYNGRSFRKVKGYKYNHVDEASGENYWISGAKRNGEDGLYGYRPMPIDADVREEYREKIRRQPEKRKQKMT